MLKLYQIGVTKKAIDHEQFYVYTDITEMTVLASSEEEARQLAEAVWSDDMRLPGIWLDPSFTEADELDMTQAHVIATQAGTG